MPVGTGTAMTCGGGSEVVGVLCSLAALGYRGIATAVGVVREQPA
jgi:hypothetical protein